MNVTCVYSSWWGNTRMVVDTIAEVFSDAWITLSLVNAYVALPEDLIKTDVVILAAPTYDHGVLHAPFEYLLHTTDAENIQMYTKRYAVVGLGDNKYDNEYNIESATLLEQFVINHGWRVICDSLKINKSPIDQLAAVRDRAHALVRILKPHG